jgi:hypothetical protein
MSLPVLVSSDLKLTGVDFEQLRAAGKELPQVECPLEHTFTKGLYTRQITMPAGSAVVSKIHKTQHPYVILEGVVDVYKKGEEKFVRLSAGHIGITEPGTERLLLVHEETVWVTFHPNPTDEQDLEKLEEMIIQCPGLPQPSPLALP